MPPILRSPKWLAGHALALAGVVVFASLGLWQLARLEERRALNELRETRAEAPAVSAAHLAAGDAESLAFRRAELRGTFLPEAEVLLSARSLEGRPGHHVLTPLRTAEGLTVVVDRGWVPFEVDVAPVTVAPPPDGEAAVRGILLPGERSRRNVERDGRLTFVTGVDPAALAPIAGEVSSLYLLAQSSEPPPGDLPVFAALPPAGEGSHLSYAGQWFLFALVVVVGYPLLLRRVVRSTVTTTPPNPTAPG